MPRSVYSALETTLTVMGADNKYPKKLMRGARPLKLRHQGKRGSGVGLYLNVISMEGRGLLPVYREPAAAVPVAATAASSSSSSSSSSSFSPLARFPPAADPAAAGAPAASRKRQHAAGALPPGEVRERARSRGNGDS